MAPSYHLMPKPKLGKVKSKGNLFFSSAKTHLEFINSGCELLNCVLGGGWPKGRIVNIVGDKSTGKTLLAIEAMANSLRDFPKERIVYNETEAAFDDAYAGALGLDMKRIVFAESSTVEELFNHVTAFCNKLEDGEGGLYIVDSLDALSDKAEMGRGIEESTYGASKPKQLGQLFRRTVKLLERKKVCLIIISQVRDAIGVTFGNKHTRSGGRALDFYASIILWLANTGQNKKTVSKIQRTIGVSVRARTSKNKIGQPFRECAFDIVFGYGVDDVSGGLEFLKESDCLSYIEPSSDVAFKKRFAVADEETQVEMREVLNEAVRKAWYEIERRFTPVRSKYGPRSE